MNDPINRRDFLKSATLLPLAAAAPSLGLGAVSALAGGEPIKRVGGSNLKTSINAYSFTGPLPQTHEDQTIGASAPMPASTKAKKEKKSTHKGGPKMTLFDLVDFCSKNNIDGCDPTGYFFPTYPTPPPDDYLYALKRHAFEMGVGISGTGVRNNFTTADKSLRDYSV